MQWNRSETLVLASQECTRCHGIGLLLRRRGRTPCTCTLRTVFRACYQRFCECLLKEKRVSRMNLEVSLGVQRRYSYGRHDEEYIADFFLITKRTLTKAEFRLFRYHYLLGADWKLCARRLNMDRGEIFHEVYRIQERLGRVFRELRPYPLYPLDEYFNSTGRSMDELHEGSRVLEIQKSEQRQPVRPPVKQAA